jgi:hypothetical protein
MTMAKYQTTVDCFFDGQLYPAGAIFEGRMLEGYDKETADYLEVLEEDTPAPKKGGGKKSAAEDEL